MDGKEDMLKERWILEKFRYKPTNAEVIGLDLYLRPDSIAHTHFLFAFNKPRASVY